uniref:Cms1 ribosomal small subunit homolog n=1 Tax=Sinocyclocheilus rhinocerous TaxID=307959 RepID=A0A673KN38_9TELE
MAYNPLTETFLKSQLEKGMGKLLPESRDVFETKGLVSKNRTRASLSKECLTFPAGFITQERSEEKGDKESNKNKKRRKKKKTITDVLTSSEPVSGSPADLLSLLKSHHSQTRSVIEQGDLTLSGELINAFCPKWAKIQKQHTQTRSVVLLIACGSALRTIDLIKQAKVLKLFAKHIKVDEQIKSLSKGVTQIAVGTPGRMCALLEKEGLTTQALRYLVLDWNYRDHYHRRMVDIPEVKVDLLKMMDHGLIQSCREGTVKIGLF